MRALRRFAAGSLAVLAVAFPALGATPPKMMANVYRLTEAGAVMNICLESPSYKALASEKASQVDGLVVRLADLVRAIGRHYKDDELYTTYEMTKARISAGPELKSYARDHYQFCGDLLLREMEAYVAENEALITGYFRKQSSRKPGP